MTGPITFIRDHRGLATCAGCVAPVARRASLAAARWRRTAGASPDASPARPQRAACSESRAGNRRAHRRAVRWSR